MLLKENTVIVAVRLNRTNTVQLYFVFVCFVYDDYLVLYLVYIFVLRTHVLCDWCALRNNGSCIRNSVKIHSVTLNIVTLKIKHRHACMAACTHARTHARTHACTQTVVSHQHANRFMLWFQWDYPICSKESRTSSVITRNLSISSTTSTFLDKRHHLLKAEKVWLHRLRHSPPPQLVIYHQCRKCILNDIQVLF